MRALGLDVGAKTIGLALGDADGVIASALGVIGRRGEQADVEQVRQRVVASGVEVVVVGLPLELDGSEGHRARRVQLFVKALRAALAESGVAVECWDERFSTAAAERTLLEADVSRQKRREKIDALAAQHLLQGWLDARGRGVGEEVGA